MSRYESFIEDDHCYCCGRTEFEVEEGKTSCCRDWVCDGSEPIKQEILSKQWKHIAVVETCCAATAFIAAWLQDLYRPYGYEFSEDALTCDAHNQTNPDTVRRLLAELNA